MSRLRADGCRMDPELLARDGAGGCLRRQLPAAASVPAPSAVRTGILPKGEAGTVDASSDWRSGRDVHGGPQQQPHGQEAMISDGRRAAVMLDGDICAAMPLIPSESRGGGWGPSVPRGMLTDHCPKPPSRPSGYWSITERRRGSRQPECGWRSRRDAPPSKGSARRR